MLEGQALPQVDQAQRVQRVSQLQTQGEPANGMIPSLYPGEEDDTGDQVLLGASAAPRWKWLNLTLDSQYFHTSNADLGTTNIKGTWLLVNSIDAEVDAPPIAVPYGQLFSEAGYRYQWFDYGIGGANDDFSNLDFDSATVYLEEEYTLPDNWAVFGNVSYNRLLNDGNGFDEFYKELVPELSVQKSVPIGQNLQATIEYSGNYRFSDEAPFPNLGRRSNNRTDQALDVGVTWQVTSKVDLRPFYRFQYSYYPDYFAGASRNDYLHTVGIATDYSFNSWSSIRLFLDYELLDTDAASVGDYRKFDVGAGVSAGIKF